MTSNMNSGCEAGSANRLGLFRYTAQGLVGKGENGYNGRETAALQYIIDI